MDDFQGRFAQAGSHLDQVEVVLDEVERGLAAFHAAEVEAERTGVVLLVAGAAVLGAAVVVGVSGYLFLKWLSRRGEAERTPHADVRGTSAPIPEVRVVSASSEESLTDGGDPGE